MTETGLVVFCSFISPFLRSRTELRKLYADSDTDISTLSVRNARMSSGQAKKALVFTLLWESSGQSRLNASARDKWWRARSWVMVSIVIEEQQR
jgi:hypothetical protein